MYTKRKAVDSFARQTKFGVKEYRPSDLLCMLNTIIYLYDINKIIINNKNDINKINLHSLLVLDVTNNTYIFFINGQKRI